MDSSQVILYYIPGKCSLSVHVLLRELNCVFKLVDVSDVGSKSQELLETGMPFKAEGKVPIVRRGSLVMRETLAILLAFAQEHRAMPVPATRPLSPEEWMCMVYLSNQVHPAVARCWRPGRVCADVTLHSEISRSAAKLARAMFLEIDGWISSRGSLRSVGPGLLDIYLLPFFRWAWRLECDVSQQLPRWSEWMAQMMQFDSVSKSLQAESLDAFPPSSSSNRAYFSDRQVDKRGTDGT